MTITISVVERPLFLVIIVSLLSLLLILLILFYLLRKKHIKLDDLKFTLKSVSIMIMSGGIIAQFLYIILNMLGYS